MKKIFITNFLLLFLIVSCSPNDPTAPNNSNGLYHLKIGDGATSIFKEYDIKNGNESLKSQYEFTITILKDTVMDGCTWYSDRVPAKTWIANKIDGVWQSDRQSNGTFDKFIIFKYPCSKGVTFDGHGDNVTVVTMDTTISISAGNFKCIHYRRIGQYYQEDTFISPGYNVIKDVGVSSDLKTVIELKSYSYK